MIWVPVFFVGAQFYLLIYFWCGYKQTSIKPVVILLPGALYRFFFVFFSRPLADRQKSRGDIRNSLLIVCGGEGFKV